MTITYSYLILTAGYIHHYFTNWSYIFTGLTFILQNELYAYTFILFLLYTMESQVCDMKTVRALIETKGYVSAYLNRLTMHATGHKHKRDIHSVVISNEKNFFET